MVESRRQSGPFRSAEDLALRVPLLHRNPLTLLARIGALNCLDGIDHRRDALWQVEEAARPVGPLLKQHDVKQVSSSSPLRQMTTEERLSADYSGTGLTVGRHPLHYRRQELQERNVLAARESVSYTHLDVYKRQELNMPAMALLDRNGVYGAARFHTLAHKHGVRAHVGAEIAVSSPRLMPPAWLPHRHAPEAARLPLLCTSRAGYQNLCQLITRFKMRETTKCEGAATLEDLEQYSSGLVCLTGGDEGPVAAALMNEGESAAVNVTEQLVRLFGRQNVYVELQRHGEREEEWRNQARCV